MTSTFRRSLKTFVDATLSPAARGKAMAEFAEKTVADLIAAGKAPPSYRRWVDGVEGAAPETVKPGGRILYEFSNIAAATLFALGFLRARSPVGPGAPKDKRYPKAYRDCFVVSVNGRPIPWDSFVPRSVPPDAEIFIFNTQAYSRKIDVQLVGRRPLRFSVPPGLFDDAAKAVRRRYGNTLTAKRQYSVSFPGQHITKAGIAVQSPALRLAVLE